MSRERKPIHLINPYDPVEDDPSPDRECTPARREHERDDDEPRRDVGLLRHLGRCPSL